MAEYTPSDEQMREAWRAFTGPNRDHGIDRFLARVKRDAAWEALDGLARAEEVRAAGGTPLGKTLAEVTVERAITYRDTHYPETED